MVIRIGLYIRYVHLQFVWGLKINRYSPYKTTFSNQTMSTSEGKETWPLSDRTAWPAAPGVTGPTTRTRPCGPLRTLCLVNGRSLAMRHCGFWVDWWMVIVLVVWWINLLLHAITPVTLSLLCTSNIKKKTKTKKIGLIGNLGHIKPKLWLHHPPPTIQQVVEKNCLTPSIWQISFDANGRNLH